MPINPSSKQESSNQNRVVLILAVVLVAVIAISAIVVLLLPGDSEQAAAPTSPSEIPTTGSSDRQSATFNLRAIQSQEYQLLDKSLVNDGSIPVQPPTNVGQKANPFL